MQVQFRIAAAITLALTFGAAAQHAGEKNGEVLVTPADLKWVDGPPSLPKGVKVALLEGNPTKPGPFVMRAKMPDGYKIAPHTHPNDERVTVISGTLYLGMGSKFEEKGGMALPTGSYARTPAGMKHFGWTKGETVIQVNGDGPWVIEYLDPKDDPRNQK